MTNAEILKKAYAMAKPGLPYVALTKEEWVEVYYAVAIKAIQIDRGELGSTTAELNVEKWSRQLKKITAKIAKVVRV